MIYSLLEIFEVIKMKLKEESKVFKIALLGLSLALYIALSFVSVNLQFIKISLTGLPVIFASVIFGPIEGMFVGFLGELVAQMLSYGFTPTTMLWVLPAVVRGLIVGLMFKQKDIKEHKVLWIITMIVCCLAVTIINTFVIYLDAKIFEYPSQLTYLTIIFRFIGSIVSAAIYALLVPALVLPLVKQGKLENEKDSK